MVALISVKGSPGATTAGLALAAAWPDPTRAVFVEADPAGGDLAARFELPSRPGLISLAAAARHDAVSVKIDDHTQRLLGGRVAAVLGGVGAPQANATLDALAASGLAWASPDRDTIVDCGRWDLRSPADALLCAADAVLVVARPQADELAHLAGRLPAVARWRGAPGLILAGRGGYPVRDIREVLPVPVMAVLPDDPRSARVLTGRSAWRPVVLRRPLLRAAAGVARALTSHAADSRPAPAESASAHAAEST